MSNYATFSADGFDVRWSSWDRSHHETLHIGWENEAWTAAGNVSSVEVEYVLRLSPLWDVRQFLLFRDLDEPDLWLGHDGNGRWGEINGAHRPDLDGSFDVTVAVTPFTFAVPIRRLPVAVGDTAVVHVADIDVSTLGVVRRTATFTRHAEYSWAATIEGSEPLRFDVDQHGLPIDIEGAFRRDV